MSSPLGGKNSMNKDKGAYKLNNIYDQLILKQQPRSDDVSFNSQQKGLLCLSAEQSEQGSFLSMSISHQLRGHNCVHFAHRP